MPGSTYGKVMYLVYFVHIQLLVDMQTNCNYFAVAKTCQKPYAKTPQKTHKNSPKTFQKSGRQKSFMS